LGVAFGRVLIDQYRESGVHAIRRLEHYLDPTTENERVALIFRDDSVLFCRRDVADDSRALGHKKYATDTDD
jgi:hypothetical protein